MLLERAKAAEERGLRYTAKNWRDHVSIVESKPASEII
jgi:hypothetical protein